MQLDFDDNTPHICEYTFQVHLADGGFDFITVYDMPERLCRKFVENKYPNLKVEALDE